MKQLSVVAILFILLSCSSHENNFDSKVQTVYSSHVNNLDNKVQTVEFHYIMWFCACANWATIEDIHKYQDTGKLSAHCVFIEPANKSLMLPDTIGYTDDIVQFTGQYYIDKGYPKGFVISEEQVKKAMIFRYTSYKIIKSNYSKFMHDKEE